MDKLQRESHIPQIPHESDYYKCNYCKIVLPKTNYNYVDHSCFAHTDFSKQRIVCNELQQILIESITCDQSEASIDNSDNLEQSFTDTPTGAKPKKRKRGNEKSVWAEYDEILIESVKVRPCLWNFRIAVKERGPLNVTEAWAEVKHILNGKFTLEEIKKRWRNLRDSFTKEFNKQKEYVPSGSAASAEKKTPPAFRFYEQMIFLKDTVSKDKSFSNIDTGYSCATRSSSFLHEDDASEDVSQGFNEINEGATESTPDNNVSEHSTQGSSSNRRRNNSTQETDFQRGILNFLWETNKPPDGVDGFLVQLGDILNRLPYQNRRLLQNKILNDALQAEEEAGLL